MNRTFAKHTLIFLFLGHMLSVGFLMCEAIFSDNSPLVELFCKDFGESEEEKSEKEVDDKCVQEMLSMLRVSMADVIDYEHSYFHFSEAHPQNSTPPPEFNS